MARALFYLLILLVLAGIGGVIYAVVAELPPPVREVEIELPAPGFE